MLRKNSTFCALFEILNYATASIVAPHDRLIKLFNMILSDPVFSGPEFASNPGGLHPGAKMLREFGKGNVLKNRAISLIDINDDWLGGVKNVVGTRVWGAALFWTGPIV